MRRLKLKDVCNPSASAVHTCLQHPSAQLGQVGNVRTVEITDIPATMSDAAVIKAWNETADASYIGNGGKYPRHSYSFDEIGSGRIIR